jgi:hypothetical protein
MHSKYVIDFAIVVARDNFVADEVLNIVHNHSVVLNRMIVVERLLAY